MASHRAPARALVLVVAAAFAAMPLTSGLTALAPAPVARAALHLPSVSGPQFIGSPGNDNGKWPASAGLVDLTNGDASVPPPTPASVTAEAGGQPLQGTAIFRADLAGTPLASTRLIDLRLEDLPSDIPLSTIPFQRSIQPTSWGALLASVARFAGLPLQSVTYSQVRAVAAFQTDLAKVRVGEVDWSRSVLADLPLAAFTFDGRRSSRHRHPAPAGRARLGHQRASAGATCSTPPSRAPARAPRRSAASRSSSSASRARRSRTSRSRTSRSRTSTCATSPLKNIPLKNIVLDVSPLKNIPLKNIDIANAPLKNIPLKNITWPRRPSRTSRSRTSPGRRRRSRTSRSRTSTSRPARSRTSRSRTSTSRARR